MNVLSYGDFTFTDDTIFSIKIATEVSLTCASLSADTLTAVVKSNAFGPKKLLTKLLEWYSTSDGEGYIVDPGDIREYTYGEPLTYVKDGENFGRYYITSVTRDGPEEFTITATSAIGLMIKQIYVGGVFGTTTKAGEVIDDIMDGTNVDYSIAQDVYDTTVSGFIPYGDKREALNHVCFPIGVNVLKAQDGSLRFVFNEPLEPTEIPDDRIFVGGSKEFVAPVTRVTVTEHDYYDDGSAVEEVHNQQDYVSSALVVFDDPIVPSTLEADSGITIADSGATFVRFSGEGALRARRYQHNTRELTWNATTVTGEEKTETVSDAYMVNALNSGNVLQRVARYYTQSKKTECEIVVQSEHAGDYVVFNDNYGDRIEGFIEKMETEVSAINRASVTIADGWAPGGGGNNYENVDAITTSGTWTLPAGKDRIRLVLIQGGQAGQKGGTAGGKGGTAGSVFIVDIDNPASTWTFTIGTGGASNYALGTHTTVTDGTDTYTSEDGFISANGYREVLSNVIYAVRGGNGIAGASAGRSLTYNGQTWHGGSDGSGGTNSYGSYRGGEGGGAAYGSHGGSGESGTPHSSVYPGGPWTPNEGGRGGRGGSAINFNITAGPGDGGNGGNGGGIGGKGGYWSDNEYEPDRSGYASSGSNGSGSPGNPGGPGIAFVYY